MNKENEITVDIPHGSQGEFHVKPPLWIGVDVYIDNTDNISIGSGCSISQGVMLFTHEHFHNPELKIMENTDRFGIKHSPLTIEDDVYIGARAIILEGCGRIGKGAVIGAGSVVTKDIPAGETWAGNPARSLKNL